MSTTTTPKKASPGQNYFPDGVPRRQLYRPGERGLERDIAKRLEYWNKLRREAEAGE